jgi:hypothetical protein
MTEHERRDWDEVGELAALAWDAYLRGQLADAAMLASRASGAAARAPREIRQRADVVCLVVAGEWERASGLAAEHLAEYPHDDLVRRVQIRTARTR